MLFCSPWSLTLSRRRPISYIIYLHINKPLVTGMSWLGVSVGNMDSVILKFFNKNQRDFNNICKKSKKR